MKMAAANALAELAQQPVHEEVKKTYSHRTFDDPKKYVIPTPYDPRLITTLPPAVAKAAADSGVAKTAI
jgi:malate dehydrogenase (oxaloacetate-decarboxylating)(NADP+)